MFAARQLCVSAVLGVVLVSCASTQGLKRRKGPKYVPETESWIKVLHETGGTGMWLVSRGYHTGDDVVSIATNAPLTHASILDLERETVVEAIGKGVMETPLEKFLSETHRVLLVKPHQWTPEAGKAAVAKARSQLGKGYDFLGTVGAPKEHRWYCSELVVWAYGVPVNKKGMKNVLHPRNMPKLGEILFDSKGRDGTPDGLFAKEVP